MSGFSIFLKKRISLPCCSTLGKSRGLVSPVANCLNPSPGHLFMTFLGSPAAPNPLRVLHSKNLLYPFLFALLKFSIFHSLTIFTSIFTYTYIGYHLHHIQAYITFFHQ